MLSDWEDWADCKMPALQKTRERHVVRDAKPGGRACEGSLVDTRPCGDRAAPADCLLQDWSEWTGCTYTCGGGHQVKIRSVAVQAELGGKPCQEEDGGSVVLQMTRGCNIYVPCEEHKRRKDCVLDTWGSWSACVVGADSIQKGMQRFRSREVLQPGAHGGVTCHANLMETVPCEETLMPIVPVDCRFGGWAAWNLCDRTCNGGQTFRKRTVEVEASQGGDLCKDSTMETAACNEIPCVVDNDWSLGGECLLSSWSSWGLCSSSCGKGMVSRTRNLVSVSKTGCNSVLEQVRGCMGDSDCDKDGCVWGEWERWSLCSRSCNGGQRNRNRTILSMPSPMGQRCAALESINEIEGCNMESCNSFGCVDGAWASWQLWSKCSQDCGGGMQWRHRAVGKQATPCGHQPEGLSTQLQKCNVVSCEADSDCVIGSWSRWGECSQSCNGVHDRTRSIEVMGSSAGKWCAGSEGASLPLQEVRSCNRPEELARQSEAQQVGYLACMKLEPHDCVLDNWNPWHECSLTCGGGQTARNRPILQKARNGGQPCNATLREVSKCNAQSCPEGNDEDCDWEEWNQWGACSRCDGETVRFRKVKTYAKGRGQGCDPVVSKEVAQCNECVDAAKTYWCVWAEWQEGDCSITCGTGGHQRRTRELATTDVMPLNPSQAVGNVTGLGAKCDGTEVDYSECTEVPLTCDTCLPEDCAFGEWSSWELPVASECDGLCSRHRAIASPANECGELCHGALSETKFCLQEGNCTRGKDCKFSNWEEWRGCEVGKGQRMRSRQSLGMGPWGVPCEGAVQQTAPCQDETLDKQDCELEDWNQWSTCSRTCGAGQRHTSRKVLVYANNGGAPCQGPMRQIKSCSETSCPEGAGVDRDCSFSDWSSWEGCPQAFRLRTMIPAMGRGLPCKGHIKESGPCARHDIDCQFADWSSWGRCATSCGGGQRYRTREIDHDMLLGGIPCLGQTHETGACNEDACDISKDCITSGWSEWSPCSSQCGEGRSQRQRGILQAAQPDGVGCSTSLVEVKGCTGTQTSAICGDDIDCRWGHWQEWSGCKGAELCGVGHRIREREIAVMPRGRGSKCDPLSTTQVVPTSLCNRSCTEAPECIDGRWGDWGHWSKCSISCGPGGAHARVRKLDRQANWCGKPAEGDREQFAPCMARPSCDHSTAGIDCAFAEWKEWDACSSSCNGISKRLRFIARLSQEGGKGCSGPITQVVRCNPGPDDATPAGCPDEEVQDCVQQDWSAWSDCSQTCGTGFMTRLRSISKPPANGGKACENPEQDMKQCKNDEPCILLDQTCKFDGWQDWTVCSPITAERRRHRTIRQFQAGSGEDCEGPDREVEGCKRTCQDKTYICEWSAWDFWSKCSTSCGVSGRRGRTRSLKMVRPRDRNGEVLSDEVMKQCSSQCSTGCPCDSEDDNDDSDEEPLKSLFERFNIPGRRLAALHSVKSWATDSVMVLSLGITSMAAFFAFVLLAARQWRQPNLGGSRVEAPLL